jgi:hypothetical protein
VLVPVLDEAEAEDLVKQALRSQSRTVLQLPFALGDGTTPWSQDLSAAVVDRLRREKHPATFAREHTAELGARLDPSVIAELQRWHDGLGDDHRYLALPLRAVIQHVSTRAAISDAFDQRSPDPSSADRPKREGHNR